MTQPAAQPAPQPRPGWPSPHYEDVLVPQGGNRLDRPMLVRRPHPGGMPGVRESAQAVADQIGLDMNDPDVIQWSRQTVAAANIPGVRGAPNPSAIVDVLRRAIKQIVAFVKDPLGTELVIATRHLLCLSGYCVRAGDCDDQLVALGSCTMSLGIPIRLRVRRYRGQAQCHITMEYDSNPRLGGPWICVDPSTDSGQCSPTAFVEEFTVDVNPNGGQLTFIGLGQVPGDELDAGLLGDPPPATLPSDQASAWATQLQIARDSLDGSRTQLRALRDAYVSVRADLGLAAVDPPPGEAFAGSDLAQYAQGGVWSAAAQSAESQLLATADFLSSAMTQGLSGARQLYWNAGDVFVESVPGDPYRVLMSTPAGSSTPVPTYFDATGNPQGTIGILPIIIGAAVLAVVSIAAAYAVGKYCDYLSQRHHDDSLNAVSTNQAALVASGKETPEQAQAQIAAMGDLAKATAPPPAAGFWTGPTVAVASIVGVVVLGVAGVKVAELLK